MEQRFTNRKFHFCSHRNLPVFFPNGKRPLYRLPAWLASHTNVLLADKSLFVRVFRAPRLLRACLCSPEKRQPIACPLGYQRQCGRPQKGKEKEGKGRGDANYKTTFFFPFRAFAVIHTPKWPSSRQCLPGYKIFPCAEVQRSSSHNSL